MNLRKILFTALVLISSINAYGEQELNYSPVPDPEFDVEKQYEAWLDSDMGNALQNMAENDDGIQYAALEFGLATSRSNNLSMKSFRRTYESAFELALTEAVLKANAEVTADRITTLAGQLPNFDDYICPSSESAYEQLIEKKAIALGSLLVREKLEATTSLSEKKIDDAIKNTPVSVKKVALQDAMKKSIEINTKWQDTSGYFVQQVFMAVGKEQEISIGVVLMKTTNISEMISQAVKSKGQFNPSAWEMPKSFRNFNEQFMTISDAGVEEYVEFNNMNEYIRYMVTQYEGASPESIKKLQMGTSVVYDKNGQPTIIGLSYESVDRMSSNSKKQRALRKKAKINASTFAMEELYRLVNLQAKYQIKVTDSISNTEYLIGEYLDCDLQDVVNMEMTTEAKTGTNMTMQSRVTQTKLKGVKRGTFNYTNPYNPSQVAYYSYAMWSPALEAKQSAFETTTGAFKRKQAEVKSPKADSNGVKIKRVVSSNLTNAEF